MIWCYLRNGQNNLDEHLQLFALATHVTINTSTGYMVNMLMLWEEVRTPADIMFGVAQANHPTDEPASYVCWLRSVLCEAHEMARIASVSTASEAVL